MLELPVGMCPAQSLGPMAKNSKNRTGLRWLKKMPAFAKQRSLLNRVNFFAKDVKCCFFIVNCFSGLVFVVVFAWSDKG